MKTKIEVDLIKKLMIQKNYTVFNEPFMLNIVGVRSIDKTVDVFNDVILIFWNEYSEHGIEQNHLIFPATTDPGLMWLKKLMNPKGTAILVPGQYDYKLGMHKNKYRALVQSGQVKVYRDNNKDNKHDFDPATIDVGYFGINIHHAGVVVPKYIGPHSAGCQVLQRKNDFDILISLAEKHSTLYGNRFKYTLITEQEINLFFEPPFPPSLKK